MKIILANPRGFCAGVERAINIVEKALEKYGPPIYVRHEIVHNKYVVDKLKAKGVVFVEELSELPKDAKIIFSAHGTPEKVEKEAQIRELFYIDATCPLVTKVHREAQSLEAVGKEIIMIGHPGHQEVIGTAGRIKSEIILVSNVEDVDKVTVNNPDQLGYITQTTLSVDETHEIITRLYQRFPKIKGPKLKDICYATQNRQNAVKDMLSQIDLLIVVGSQNSSNSNRLRDIGAANNINSYLVDNPKQIQSKWINNAKLNIGITAGASAPESLVEDIINHIITIRPMNIENFDSGVEENIKFKMPEILN